MKARTASFWDKFGATVPLVALYAKNQDFPSKHLWDSWTHQFWPTVPLLLVTSAVFAAVSPFSTKAQTKLIDKRVGVQHQILSQFGKVIGKARGLHDKDFKVEELQKQVNVQPEMLSQFGTAIREALTRHNDDFKVGDPALHIWQAKRFLRHFGCKRLKRISVYRLGGEIMTQTFQPKKGQGVVGTCWKLNNEFSLDVKALAEKAPTEDAFNQLGESEKMGLTWQQFNDFRTRGSIFASPIRKVNSDKSARGCLSLDFHGNHAELVHAGIQGLLNELAMNMRSHGFEEM